MEIHGMRTETLSLLASMAVAFATSAAAAKPADAWITTKTKVALLADPDVDGTKINVDTWHGTVTLHGSLPTAAQEKRALEVARGIEGVTNVRDLLEVAGESKAPMTPAVKDEALEGRVEKALDEARLPDSSIKVDSVKNGVVQLSGHAASLTDERRALAHVRVVPGVVRVTNDIEAPAQMAAGEGWQERKTSKDKVVSTAGDMWITSAVKLRLLASDQVPGTAVNVDTDDGVVTLFGIVPTETSKTTAEAEAKKVDDVKKVVNALQVVAEEKQAAVEKKDDEILTAVRKAVGGDADLAGADVDVAVKNGVVRLTGTVDSQSDRLSAAMIARAVPGVRSVSQGLEIKVATPKGG
jgi:hyperosmotically inducible protein